jgi:ABC-2 type transport system permease protein
MRNFRLRSSRRGAIFSIAVAAIWYGFWFFIAFLAYALAAEAHTPAELAEWLPVGLLFVFLYWQIAPVMTASFGASLDTRKLLAYPIPRRSLFAVEVLLRLTTCSEMLLVLAGGLGGVLRNPVAGGWTALPRVAAAALLFVCFNLLLAAGLHSLIERLLARKRIRELLILVLVLITALPRLLVAAGVRSETFELAFSPARVAILPWSATARAALGYGFALSAVLLVLWTAAAAAFARWQFFRSLRFDAEAARATDVAATPRADAWSERFYRLPALVLPDPLAAIVEKELRSLSRTPRFRTVFIMGFTFGLLVWLPLIMGRGGVRHSRLAENFLVVVALYAFTLLGQVSYWNAFGFDRSAAQAWFVFPPPVSRALIGKNLAAALFILMEVVLVTAACLLLRVPIPPERVFEAFVVTPVAALYMLSLGNLASVNFPRPMSPDRTSQGGAASRFQGFLFLVYPFALLPILLAYLARYAFDSTLAFYLVLAFAAALGAAVYWISMESAVAAARTRRELIIEELSKGGGPVLTE